MIEVAPQRSTLRVSYPRLRIDANALHGRQIDDQAAVVGPVSRGAVASAANRNEQPEQAREVDRVLDVRDPCASRDEGRAAVDVAVPHAPRLVEAGVARDHELAA